MTVKKLITGMLLVLTFFPAPQFAQALSMIPSTDTTTTTSPTTTLSTSPSTNLTTPALAVTVDTTAPMVSGITPKIAVVGTAVTLSSAVSDDVGVTTCTLLLTDSAKVVTKSAMTLTTAASGTTAAASTTFKTAGKYGAAALCNDLTGNSTRGTTVVITVSTSSTATPLADTTAPKVGIVSPLVATVGTAVTLTSTVSDDVSLSSCFLIITDSKQASTKTAMTLATNAAGVSSATLSETFQTAEKVSAVVSCADMSGNRGNSIAVTIVVSAVATSSVTPTITTGTTSTIDSTAPVVGIVSPLTATVGTSQTFSTTVSDAQSISSCVLLLTNSAGTIVKTAMTVTALAAVTTASASYSFKDAGRYGAFVSCKDSAGNAGDGKSVTVVVSSETSTLNTPSITPGTTTSLDATAPVVGIISPLVATVGVTQKFSTTATDTNAIASCVMSLTNAAGTVAVPMTLGDTFGGVTPVSVSYAFKNAGSFVTVALCKDASGNEGKGKDVTVVVASATTQTSTQSTTPGGTAPTFTVGTISPVIAVKNVATPLTATITGATSLTNMSCTLSLITIPADGSTGVTTTAGMTTATSVAGVNTASISYTFTATGRNTAFATCVEKSLLNGNTTAVGKGVVVTVGEAKTQSSSNFTVGGILPTTAIVSVQTKLSAPITGISSITEIKCTLEVTVGTRGGSMGKSDMVVTAASTGGTAAIPYTFTEAGIYTVFAICLDANGNSAPGTSTVVTVTTATTSASTAPGGTAPTIDTTTQTPTTPVFAVGAVAPVSAVVGVSTAISAPILNASSLMGMKCSFLLTNSAMATSIFSMTPSAATAGDMASLTFTFKSTETYSAFAACTDALGAKASGKPVAITVTTSTTQPAAGTTEQPVSTTTEQTPVTTQAPTSSDVMAPVIGSLTPAQFTTGIASVFSVGVSDDSGETGLSCVIVLSLGRTQIAKAPTVIANGIATATYKFLKGGSYIASVLCSDAAQNRVAGLPTTITVTDPAAAQESRVAGGGLINILNIPSENPPPSGMTATPDITPPTIGNVNPQNATIGIPVVIGAVVSDVVGVTSCTYSLDEIDRGQMVVANGEAKAKYAFKNGGDHTILIFCADAAGNVGKSKLLYVRVGALQDTTAPLVGTIPAIQATVNVPIDAAATYVDNIGVTSCHIYLDAADAGAMALSNGVATAAVTVDTDGTHSLYVGCVDAAGNVGASESATTFNVAKASGDLTVPFISAVSPTSTTQNLATIFSVTATDDSEVKSCNLFVDNADQGEMTMIAGSTTFSRSYTFAKDGTFSVYADCMDAVGNDGVGTSTDVVVSAAVVMVTDSVAPTVGAITPSSTVTGTLTTLSASIDDSVGVTSCELYIDSVDIGSMTIANGTASFLYTFTIAGSAAANAYCKDAAGNGTRGASTMITVEDALIIINIPAETVTNSSATADPGSLMKLACYENSDANDPCKAVYFYSKFDGKRHVFTSANAFFTWYTNFDSVMIVSDSFMGSIALGKNVVYRPGTKLVKFDSSPVVYVVKKGGVLHALPTEGLAAALYGSDWNTKIDVISDAFFGNYTFGKTLETASDFNVGTEDSSVVTIDGNLE